jgi:translation initiation factor IF-2
MRPRYCVGWTRSASPGDAGLIDQHCGAHTVPYIEAKNSKAVFEHKATTSKISSRARRPLRLLDCAGHRAHGLSVAALAI